MQIKPDHYDFEFKKTIHFNVNDVLEAIEDKINNENIKVDLMTWNYYCQAMKYIMRSFFKGQQKSDLKKAITEIEFIINNIK